MRIIQKAKYNAHTQPISASLNIYSLYSLYQQKLHLIHAFIHFHLPKLIVLNKFMILYLEMIEIFSYLLQTPSFKRFFFLFLPIGLE